MGKGPSEYSLKGILRTFTAHLAEPRLGVSMTNLFRTVRYGYLLQRPSEDRLTTDGRGNHLLQVVGAKSAVLAAPPRVNPANACRNPLLRFLFAPTPRPGGYSRRFVYEVRRGRVVSSKGFRLDFGSVLCSLSCGSSTRTRPVGRFYPWAPPWPPPGAVAQPLAAAGPFAPMPSPTPVFDRRRRGRGGGLPHLCAAKRWQGELLGPKRRGPVWRAPRSHACLE